MKKPRSKPDASSELLDKALVLISSKAEGILQSELRKILDIDSSKCSRIVSKLEKQGHISRERFTLGGSRTYVIRPANMPLNRFVDMPINRTVDSHVCKSRKGDFLSRNIDSYLTEIYLLYLIRGASSERPTGGSRCWLS